MTRRSPRETSARLCRPKSVVALAVEPRPQRIEAPFAPLAAMGHAPEHELDRRQHHFLEGRGAPVVEPEGDVEGDEVEPEEAAHRPEAEQR